MCLNAPIFWLDSLLLVAESKCCLVVIDFIMNDELFLEGN